MINLESLNNLKVVNVEADLGRGFFWVEFDNGRSLQCCLKEQMQSNLHFFIKGPEYLNAIDSRDCGFDQGQCADVNKWAVGEDGEWGHILDFLLANAARYGVDIL